MVYLAVNEVKARFKELCEGSEPVGIMRHGHLIAYLNPYKRKEPGNGPATQEKGYIPPEEKPFEAGW